MLIIKAFIGALAVILIQIFAQSRYYYLAALVPLFPTFALISHVILGTMRTPAEFKAALLFSSFSLIPYLGYILAVYFSIDRFSLWISLLIGLIVWVILSAVLIYLWQLW
ncbi:GlpM family protein [Suttonella ornithocola]|uniref:Inner membrane protein ydgC n=1 Tax=Suttonella ornithocola TaxID=279832 RepID=A0A380MUL1_9GAMM|nr:GlpM family protein [Suttonella ornithocola]SUO95952.1 Inner membrane protein ydgC [Suttonella ornithocola]